jgi:hypothetical protein
MSVYTNPETYNLLRFGKRVDRVAANLPQTAAAAIFNITGGRVAITKIVGEVTTIMEAAANNIKLTANPTVGGSVDICAVVEGNGKVVGSLVGITGEPSDAMIINASIPGQISDVVLKTGTLDLVCSASRTGAIKWSIWYTSLDDGAEIVAA